MHSDARSAQNEKMLNSIPGQGTYLNLADKNMGLLRNSKKRRGRPGAPTRMPGAQSESWTSPLEERRDLLVSRPVGLTLSKAVCYGEYDLARTSVTGMAECALQRGSKRNRCNPNRASLHRPPLPVPEAATPPLLCSVTATQLMTSMRLRKQ